MRSSAPTFVGLTLLAGCSLITDLGGLSPPGAPADAGTDQTVVDSAVDAPSIDGGDAAPIDPTWTVGLPSKSSLRAIAVDSNGDVYVAGALAAPMTLGSIVINATQGLDALVIKFDGKTKQPVWAKTFASALDDFALGIAAGNGALFVMGTTYGTSMTVGNKTLNIPASSGPNDSHSFLAKIDPVDGSTVVVLSPDSGRTAGQSHFSNCGSIAVKDKEIVIGCAYSGAGFAFQSFTPLSAAGVVRYTDSANSFSPTWVKSIQPGYQGSPVVTLDAAGDVWLGYGVSQNTAVSDDLGNALFTSSPQSSNPYVAKIADSTRAVGPVRAWSADKTSLLRSPLTSVAVNGSNVFVTGSYIGNGNFGATPVVSQGFDGYFLRLNLNLDTQAQLVFGGPGFDGFMGLAPDGNGNVYTSLFWSAPGSVLNGKPLPDPPGGTGATATALGKINSAGTPTPGPASLSATGNVRFVDVISRSSLLYGVGFFSGATTFDDGTTLTAALEGNGFFVRRAAF